MNNPMLSERLKPKDALISLFLGLCSVIFSVTAVAKLITVIQGESKLLTLPDPVFPLPTNWLLAIVALSELALALWLALSQANPNLKIRIIGLVSILFFVYKIGNLWLKAKPCSCLGVLIKWSPWLEAHRDEITWSLLAFMLLGSVLIQFVNRDNSQRDT